MPACRLINTEWALEQIDEFLRLTDLYRAARPTRYDDHRQLVEQPRLAGGDRSVRRRDISETDLFKQVFTLDAPQPGKARLRIVPDDGSRTYESMHRGARALAEGCYAAMRNPVSHTVGDLAEHEALEQLAAFSVLARWVNQASLETV